jgi:hypothetical protein
MENVVVELEPQICHAKRQRGPVQNGDAVKLALLVGRISLLFGIQ